MDAAFSFSSEFRQCGSLSPQSTSTVSCSLESPPSPSDLQATPRFPALNGEFMPNKSIVKPAAAAMSGFSYEQTLAKGEAAGERASGKTGLVQVIR